MKAAEEEQAASSNTSRGHHCAAVYEALADRILTGPADRQRLARSNRQYARTGLADYLFATAGQPSEPGDVFDRLRWGGQLIFVCKKHRQVERLYKLYRKSRDFHTDEHLQSVVMPRQGFSLRLRANKYYYFVARKVALTRAEQMTERYSYDVRLVPQPDYPHGYIVRKQVPTYDQALRRLSITFPHVDKKAIESSAQKLVNKVFPLLLSREAAFLKLLQHRLPESLRSRVPTVLSVAKDTRGLVRVMHLNWLRMGGEPISQLDFARQSAGLLHIVHETVGLIHMDLRLDNFVVTDDGVGFVDFGSAALVGEDLESNPMLNKLFHEMLSASQIQAALARLRDKGTITSSLLLNSYHKVDKAVDLFYLVLQMNKPHANPDFRGLVKFDPRSDEARHVSNLTRMILRPANPQRPEYCCARDLLAGLNQIKRAMAS